MHDLPRQKLRELIAEYGLSLCEDPRRVEALLKDLCGQHRREIFVLVSALRERVVEELRNSQASVPASIVLPSLAKRLHDNLGFKEDIARWAVESWALALGFKFAQAPPLTIPNPPPLGAGLAQAPLGQAPSLAKTQVKPAQKVQNSPLSVIGPARIFRDSLKSGGAGPEMVVIPAGSFLMGSPPGEPERDSNEGPQHTVTFAKPFAIGRFAVTFEEFDRFCLAQKRAPLRDRGNGRGRQPVIGVSSQRAHEYCAWLSHQTDQQYRLPSEAEWEYACRAGTYEPFNFGSAITTRQANYDGDYGYNGGPKGRYRMMTVPVEQFQPNAFGLFQMHGNVSEWCEDVWHDDYHGAPQNGKAWMFGGKPRYRVVRGGSWCDFPNKLRSASRSRTVDLPSLGSINTGFRLVRD